MDDRDPTKPETNREKFKPQNVAREGKHDTDRAPETRRRDLPRGSEPETRSASTVRR